MNTSQRHANSNLNGGQNEHLTNPGNGVGLGCLICLIMVVIKMFQNEGALHGILGIICGLYAFIWGWMNANRLGIKTIMMIWTALIILSIILNVAGGAMMGVNPAPYGAP